MKHAIYAGLAIDADPYYYMADSNINPSAKLTPAGEEIATAAGWRVKCADNWGEKGGCNWWVPSPAIGGPEHGRCSGCDSSYRSFGRPNDHEFAKPGVCGACHITMVRKHIPGYTRPEQEARFRRTGSYRV